MRGERRSHIQIGEWIDIAARQVPDRACFVLADGTERSYREEQRRIHDLAAGLAARGAHPGDRIAILATDSAEYLETLFAIAKLGAVSVPLNYRLSGSEVEHLLAVAQPSWLLASDRYAELAGKVAAGLDDHCEVVVYERGHGLSYDDLLATGAAARDGEPFAHVEVDDEDIFSLAFTSGTTGTPKGVMQSHRMFKQIAANTVLEYRFQRDEFRYSAAPLFHVAGMGLVMNTVLRCQTSLVLPQFDATAVVHWLRNGLTGVFLVPTMISSILQVPGVEAGGFDSLRTLFYGASPMSTTLLAQTMQVFDCDFFNGFSAGTEAGMQTLLTPEDHERALAGEPHLLTSIGRPGFAVDLRIVDDDMHDVPRGEVGEIATRSDMVMSGYLGQPELTARAVIDGWFRGGDLAWQDEEGYLFLAGRKNDMIIRGGENVYPVEIESVLAAYPGVAENAVVGAPDDHWGEIVKAFVVPADARAGLDVDDLLAHCHEQLAAYKVPAVVVVVPDELPKNASGKILKRELRTWR